MTPKLRRIVEFLDQSRKDLEELAKVHPSEHKNGQVYETNYILDKVWEIISDDSK